MPIALQLCEALVLTAILVTVATFLAALQLGRLVTRDDEQRVIETASELGIPSAERPGRARTQAMKSMTTPTVVVVVALLAGVPLVSAEAPQESRKQCVRDLTACKQACIDVGGFDGCEEQCGWVYEDCLNGKDVDAIQRPTDATQRRKSNVEP